VIEPGDSASIPVTLPDGAVRFGTGVLLDWGGRPLEKVATLDLSLPDAVEGATVYQLVSGGSWARLGGTIDTERKRISLVVSEPAAYAIFTDIGSPSINGAQIYGLTLTPRVLTSANGGNAASVAVGFNLATAGAITVRAYNRAGRLVRVISDHLSVAAGAYLVRWDGMDESGSRVEDGLYLVTVESRGQKITRVLAVELNAR
jgi:hypothetical protein